MVSGKCSAAAWSAAVCGATGVLALLFAPGWAAAQGSGDSGGCPDGSTALEVWRGLPVCEELDRSGFEPDAFGADYLHLGPAIVERLPPTMRDGSVVYTPYSCRRVLIPPNGSTLGLAVDHLVDPAEAHDSGLLDHQRRAFVEDFDNLTVAGHDIEAVKHDRDAGEWRPERHGRWFADQVIGVKRKYGLAIDTPERDALDRLIDDPEWRLECVGEVIDTERPRVEIRSLLPEGAEIPVPGSFSIGVAFSEPVTGFDVGDMVVDRGYASDISLLPGSLEYSVLITPTLDGVLTVDIPQGAAKDAAGNDSHYAERFSIRVRVTPVPALPGLATLALMLVFVLSGLRRIRPQAPR